MMRSTFVLVFILTLGYANAQDTLYTASIATGPNASIYNVTGEMSVTEVNDSFFLNFHSGMEATAAPDVHLMFLKILDQSIVEGNEAIIIHRFEDTEPIMGPRQFVLTKEQVDAIDSFRYVGLECVQFGNIHFGGGEFIPSNDVASNRSRFVDPSFVNIYPNPTMGQLNFLFRNNEYQVEGIDIIALDGKMIRSLDSVPRSIDVSDLTKGTYSIQLRLKDGLLLTKSFVKQ